MLRHGYDNNTYAHLRISPYKEGVTIVQIQMPFLAGGRSLVYELLAIVILFWISRNVFSFERGTAVHKKVLTHGCFTHIERVDI